MSETTLGGPKPEHARAGYFRRSQRRDNVLASLCAGAGNKYMEFIQAASSRATVAKAAQRDFV